MQEAKPRVNEFGRMAVHQPSNPATIRFSQPFACGAEVRIKSLERLKKYCSRSERGFLVFWRGFGEGAGLNNPVTEPKRRQKPKRPLSLSLLPNGYSIFENALTHNLL